MARRWWRVRERMEPMGYYPEDDREKADRAKARERERREKERTEREARREARRRERAERLAAARAAWDEANGAEQTRMLAEGAFMLLLKAGRLLWRALCRAWRWLFTEPGGFARNSEGRMRDAVFLGGLAVVVIGSLFGGAVLIALDERDAARRDAPKCRAVYEQIAAAPDDLAYQKATTLLRELTCTARSVPEPERIGELMGGGSAR